MSEEELPEQAVQKLVAWRQRNGLSQRAAVEFMQAHNLPVTLTALEKWESGERRLRGLAAHAVLRFLEDHPVVSEG
jgi:DNA-binding transcriptional regulator YiaG